MGKSLLGALVGALIGVLAGAWLVQFQARANRGWVGPDLWPGAAQAELRIARGLDEEGLPTLVALGQELHALHRQRSLEAILFAPHWLRAVFSARAPADDAEEHALDFMINKVTAALDAELDRWQDNMARVNELDPVARDAALRLLAFVKWQQKGGEYAYAYDFFDELSRTAARQPPKPTEVTVESTPRPAPPTPRRRRAGRQ
jgi:hypothetical protein